MNVKLAAILALIGLKTVSPIVAGAAESENPQTAQEAANLEKALYCMNLLENRNDLEPSSRIKALRRECIADTYVQHSPHVPDGRDAVMNLFASRYEVYPNSSIDIKRSVAGGDLVWIHLHAKKTPDDRGHAVINIFRMENGKFVEHWNVVQAVPEESKNDNTMF